MASSTEILTAIAGDINLANGSSVTITNTNYTLAQLNTIADAGVTTTTVSNTSVALSGSVADLAVLDDIANYAGTITVTGNYNLAQLQTIDTYTTGTIKVANTSVALSGNADELAAMLPTLAGYKGAVTVSDTITLAELKAINNATTGAITLVDQSGPLSGSAADILAAFKGIKSYEGAVEVTGTDYKLADLKAINAITDGALTVTTSTVALTGTAKDLVAALDGVTTYAGKVTVTGSYTVADLKAINTAVSGDTVLASKNVALTGKISDITAALTGITDYAGAIKLTDVPANTAELVSIANLTKGKITLPANGYIDLDATAAVLQPLLAKINGAYKGDVTVSTLDADTVKALAQLKAINDATSGDVTVTTASPLEGSIKDIQAALKGITGFDAAITVTDAKYTLAQLKTIVDSMDATVDTLILDVNAPLSGSVEALNAVLVKVPNTYAGDITVTGNYSLTQLKDLNTETAGTIKVANTSVALSGNADELAAMLPTLAGYKGAVTVSDTITLAELKAINNATTGAITLVDQSGPLSGSAADILAAFKGIKSYEGAVEVTGTDYKLADLKAINTITNGAFTVDSPIALTGTAKDLAAALNGVTGYTDVTVTGSYTVAELKAINAAVADSVVLTSKNVALTGTVADIKAALAGITDYTGAIKVTDSSIDATELADINALTTGKITLPANGHDDLTGDVTTVTNALQGITGYKGTVTVTVDGTTTLAQLKTITNSTVNKAEFNTVNPATTANTTLEGTAKDITAVLNKFSTLYAGDLTVTGSYTLADLVALDKLLATDAGTVVTLDNTINLSGKSADIAAALSNVTGYAGKITLSDKPTLGDLIAINAATTEAIKIPTDTALTGTATQILQALNGVEGHKGNITVTPAAAAADVNTIAGLTTGLVRATIADGAVKTTLDAIAKVATTDIITFTTNDTSVDASDLVALKAKVDNLTTTTVDTITEAYNTASLTTVVLAAEALATGADVKITGGAISAADLNTLASDATIGNITATIKSDSTVKATLDAITNVNAADTITYTTTQATVDASDLVALGLKVDTFNTGSVTKITETAASVASVDTALTLLNTDADVKITDGTITKTAFDLIDINTAGSIDVSGITLALADATTAINLSDLSSATGLLTLNTTTTAINAITITAADLFAANDSLGDITLTINADATDTLTLTGWTPGATAQSGYDLYSTTGNFDGVAGNETYTVKVTTGVVVA